MTTTSSVKNNVTSNAFEKANQTNVSTKSEKEAKKLDHPIDQTLKQVNHAIQETRSTTSTITINGVTRPMTSEEESKFDQKMKKIFGTHTAFDKSIENAKRTISNVKEEIKKSVERIKDQTIYSEKKATSTATITENGVTRNMTPEEIKEFDQKMKSEIDYAFIHAFM